MTDRTTEQAPAPAAAGPTPPNIADIEESLRDVVDPELGINVVDLGLIYGITVDQHAHSIRRRSGLIHAFDNHRHAVRIILPLGARA